MSKYQLLWKYLQNNKCDTYYLSFTQIEDILGFSIDHAFLTYKKEALEYGYEVVKIYMKEKKIIFKKVSYEK